MAGSVAEIAIRAISPPVWSEFRVVAVAADAAVGEGLHVTVAGAAGVPWEPAEAVPADRMASRLWLTFDANACQQADLSVRDLGRVRDGLGGAPAVAAADAGVDQVESVEETAYFAV